MKLLIVDDSRIIRRAIQRYLDSHDIEVIGEAGDGKTALEIFKEKDPDVVTLDITMPEMDGLTCLQEMLKIKSSAKIMVISALRDKFTAIEALKKGAKNFLSKPFTQEELSEAFSELMEGEEDA